MLQLCHLRSTTLLRTVRCPIGRVQHEGRSHVQKGLNTESMSVKCPEKDSVVFEVHRNESLGLFRNAPHQTLIPYTSCTSIRQTSTAPAATMTKPGCSVNVRSIPGWRLCHHQVGLATKRSLPSSSRCAPSRKTHSFHSNGLLPNGVGMERASPQRQHAALMISSLELCISAR